MKQSPRFDFESAWRVALEFRSYAFLVLHEGVIHFERYANGGQVNRPTGLASGSKSFVGPLALCAVQDGLFRSLDERVAETVPEWRADPRKSRITLRHLLNLTSGLSGSPTTNWISYEEALSQPARWEPGTHFAYSPIPFLAFGGVLTRKLRSETVESYLNRRLFDPLGIKVSWQTTRGGAGEIALPGGANTTAREWATYGQFLLQQGVWQGRKLLPEAALQQCYHATSANPAYGLTFWLNVEPNFNGRGAITRKNFAMAAGLGGQRLYLLFDIATAVVRLGPFGVPNFQDVTLLKALLPDFF